MIKISNYLMTHYKGTYRIKCEYDLSKNQFARKLDGTYEDIDCYIDCYKNIKIFYYGKSILEAYIPSLIRGNIVKLIQSDNQDEVIFDIRRTDSEVLFKFKAKYMNILEKYLKPKTGGASIGPFSSKNLPKNKNYKIPDEELVSYKKIIEKLDKKQMIDISLKTKGFLKSIITKNNSYEDIKSDMAMKGLYGKNYIHSIGYWNEYLSYLERELL